MILPRRTCERRPKSLLEFILISIGAVGGALCLAFSFLSFREREPRAGWISLVLALLAPLPYVVTAVVPFPGHVECAEALLIVTAVVAVALLLPIDRRLTPEKDTPGARFDERDLVFVRRKLKPGDGKFEAYYARHPERRAVDDALRAAPGVLSPESAQYHRLVFTGVRGSLNAIYALLKERDGAPAPQQAAVAPQEATRFLKAWCLQMGAHSVGVAALQDYHLYSHGGYRDNYGVPVERHHPFAIALTVEMDRSMTRGAPAAPAWLEAAKQYEAGANIAMQLSILIRHLGYSARAQVFDNYEVVAPLVARDAGLGEIGRMGLLMTPRLGPRVRIAIVTSNLPLVPDERTPEPAAIDFCLHCTKCADACPGRAIPFGDRNSSNGGLRWVINPERCYRVWCTMGTPCGRCMAVCPHGHPNAFPHNWVRVGVRHSYLFRRFAILMDDILYGKVPAPLPMPEWMQPTD